MKYLLDTSVYSQPLRRKPVIAVFERWREAGDRECAVSVVTIAEVEYGLGLEERPERWEKYRLLLDERLGILDTTAEVWREFARRKARQHALGRSVSDLDLLIASTAIVHKLTVATLNAKDFSRIESVAWQDWSA